MQILMSRLKVSASQKLLGLAELAREQFINGSKMAFSLRLNFLGKQDTPQKLKKFLGGSFKQLIYLK